MHCFQDPITTFPSLVPQEPPPPPHPWATAKAPPWSLGSGSRAKVRGDAILSLYRRVSARPPNTEKNDYLLQNNMYSL